MNAGFHSIVPNQKQTSHHIVVANYSLIIQVSGGLPTCLGVILSEVFFYVVRLLLRGATKERVVNDWERLERSEGD
jgi:ABC-type branched-subunit amino acid transport system permease subunit